MKQKRYLKIDLLTMLLWAVMQISFFLSFLSFFFFLLLLSYGSCMHVLYVKSQSMIWGWAFEVTQTPQVISVFIVRIWASTPCGNLELKSISTQRKVTYFMDPKQAQIHIPLNCNLFAALAHVFWHMWSVNKALWHPLHSSQPEITFLFSRLTLYLMEMDY